MKTTDTATRNQLHAQLMDVERAHQSALASERQILQSAQDRLIQVQHELTEIKPHHALLDDRVADRYQALILERGQLHQVIALAKHTLKNS